MGKTTAERYREDPEYAKTIKDAQTKHFQKLKFGAMKKLGFACSECGDGDYRALHFDHINNDGAEDRRSRHDGAKGKNSNSWARNLMLKQIISGERIDIQLLCGYCHAVKTWKFANKVDYFPEFINMGD